MGRHKRNMGCGQLNEKEANPTSGRSTAGFTPAPASQGPAPPTSPPRAPPTALQPRPSSARDTTTDFCEKYPNERLIKKLYSEVKKRKGKYTLPHFGAHMDELNFKFVTGNGHPSYGLEDDKASFEAAGGMPQVDQVTALVWTRGPSEGPDGEMKEEVFLEFFEKRNQVVSASAAVLEQLIEDAGELEYLGIAVGHKQAMLALFAPNKAP